MVRAGIRAVPSARGRRRGRGHPPARLKRRTVRLLDQISRRSYVMHANEGTGAGAGAGAGAGRQAGLRTSEGAPQQREVCPMGGRRIPEDLFGYRERKKKKRGTPLYAYNSCFDLQCGSTLQTRKGSRKSQRNGDGFGLMVLESMHSLSLLQVSLGDRLSQECTDWLQ